VTSDGFARSRLAPRRPGKIRLLTLLPEPIADISALVIFEVMSMLWIALATQLTLRGALRLPDPDPRGVFSPDDMPAYVQIDGINRFVATRTTVRPDGKTQDCAIEGGSGDPKLDAYTCAIILRRAKFQPATWLDGTPVFGVLRLPVSWTIGGPPSKSELESAYPNDLDLSVTRLPADAGRRTNLRLMIAVDENGKVVGCSEPSPVSQWVHTRSFHELVPIACDHLRGEFTAIPARDASGKFVRSVQTVTIGFNART